MIGSCSVKGFNGPILKLKLSFFLYYAGEISGYEFILFFVITISFIHHFFVITMSIFLSFFSSFFLLFKYSVWFSTQPNISVMPTQIVSYDSLTILYAWSPLVSICGPIVIGINW